jgi:signal peptidase II
MRPLRFSGEFMSFKHKALLIITPLVFIADQLTKWLVVKYIPLKEGISIIPGYFDLVHFQNKGAAFGMLSSLPEGFRQYFFYIVAVIAVVILAVFCWQYGGRSKLLPVAIALVLGGIAGNILDRIRFGAVTDFISVHIRDAAFNFNLGRWHINIPLDWPAFNVADSAITIAMFLLIASAFGKEWRQP